MNFLTLRAEKARRELVEKKHTAKNCERKDARSRVKRKTGKRRFIVENRELVKKGKKICEKCEKLKKLNEFPILYSKTGQTGIGGRKSYCKQCEREAARKRLEDPLIRVKSMLASYKHSDKRKFGDLGSGYLKLSTLLDFQKMKCCYCGDTQEFMGADRKDNSMPHVEENCVPCCKLCNRIKSDMSDVEFTNYIKKVYQNLRSGSST